MQATNYNIVITKDQNLNKDKLKYFNWLLRDNITLDR